MVNSFVTVTHDSIPEDRKTDFVAWTLASHNLPTDRARELIESSREAKSHL